jgi:hypothetical protein
MKAAALLFLALLQTACFAVDDTNAIALGPWSEPVANYYGAAIRGRLGIYEHRHRGPVAGVDTALYLELEEASDFFGARPEVYFHLGQDGGTNGLHYYFVSGTFTVTPPTNYVPKDFRWVWQGTLKLPQMEIPARSK